MSKKIPVDIVSEPYELKEAARSAKMALFDDDEKGIFTAVDVATSPRGIPLITMSKRVERMDLRDRRDEVIVDGIEASRAGSFYDMSVKGKVEDVMLPYKDSIRNYAPLTDVTDDNMRIFITRDACEHIEDNGVHMDLMTEELMEVRNIEATGEQIDLTTVVDSQREKIAMLKRSLGISRSRIVDEHPDWRNLDRPSFIRKVATECTSQEGKIYLKLSADLEEAHQSVDTYAAQIMSTSADRVWIPDHVSMDDIRLPGYDIFTETFRMEKLPLAEVSRLANGSIMPAADFVPSLIDIDIDTEINFSS